MEGELSSGGSLVILCGVVLLSYLLGSVPYGLVLAKNFCGIDPRTAGSGNVGATNVARLCGKKWGALTLFCDLAKGAFAVFLAFILQRLLSATPAYAPQVAAFFVVIGHMFPAFLHFKGGKGVATTVGIFLALSFLPFLLAVLLCVLVIWRTGFVSAGSLVLAIATPIVLYCFGDTPNALLGIVIGLLIIYAHRENIKRLAKGEEKPWNTPKKSL